MWACLSTAVLAQAPAKREPYKLEVYADLVQVPTLVLNSLHKPLIGLPPESFSISLDGHPLPQPAHVHLQADDPIAFAILLDVSHEKQLEMAQSFSDNAEQSSPSVFTSSDRLSIFADDRSLVRSLQNAPATMSAAHAGIADLLASPAVHSGTTEKSGCGAKRQLWNVMATTIFQLQKLPGRRVLLVVSDGRDHGSTTSSDAVRKLALRLGVTIFALKPQPLSTRSSPYEDGKPQFEIGKGDELATFCAGTGGLTFYDKSESIDSTITRVVKLLRSRYILDFPRPKNIADGEHTIGVRVPDASAIIRVSGTIFPSRERLFNEHAETLFPDPFVAASASVEKPEPSAGSGSSIAPPTEDIHASPVAAQPVPQQPVPTLHANAQLLYLDIVARDRHGRAVRGLSRDDFQVSERTLKSQSEPQKIAFFEDIDSTHASQLSAPDPQHLSASQSITVLENQSHTILLIDELNTNLGGQRDVIDKLAAMIDEIPQRTPSALFTTMNGQLIVLQDFTLDHALLKQAAKRAFPPGAISFSSPAGQLNLAADPNARYAQSAFVTFAAKSTGTAFQQIASRMSTVPGRKNLIWISDSFPSEAPPDAHQPSRSFYASDVLPAIAALSAARVAVYSVPVSGPEPRHPGVDKTWKPPVWQRSSAAGGGVSNIGPAAAPPEMIAVSDIAAGIVSDDLERTMRQSTMRTISEKTGGIVCTNVYDLPGCVAKAMDDSSHFYEISYYPTSHLPGTHNIIVKARDSGVTLTYRQSYVVEAVSREGK